MVIEKLDVGNVVVNSDDSACLRPAVSFDFSYRKSLISSKRSVFTAVEEFRRPPESIWSPSDEDVVDHPWRRMQKLCVRVAVSHRFDTSMGLCVALNSICIGLESEMSAEAVISFFRILDLVFLCLFCFELLVRLAAFGRELVTRPIMLFDVVIVVAGVATELFATGVNLSVLKVLRALRCFRVLRMLTMFQDLWVVVASFFLCLRPLFWTVLFTLIIMFMFAMFAVELIGENEQFAGVNDAEGNPARARFSSSLHAMVVLFQVMTLDDWQAVTQPFFNTAAWTFVFFMIYIAISVFALKNLVTAAMVDSVMKSQSEVADWQRDLFDARVLSITESLEQLFECLDADQSGVLDVDAFCKLAPETTMIPVLCTALHLDAQRGRDLKLIFDALVNEPGSKEVLIHDLVIGLIRLEHLGHDKDAVACFKDMKSHEEMVDWLRAQMEEGTDDLNRLQGSLGTKLEDVYCMIQELHSDIHILSDSIGGVASARARKAAKAAAQRKTKHGAKKRVQLASENDDLASECTDGGASPSRVLGFSSSISPWSAVRRGQFTQRTSEHESRSTMGVLRIPGVKGGARVAFLDTQILPSSNAAPRPEVLPLHTHLESIREEIREYGQTRAAAMEGVRGEVRALAALVARLAAMKQGPSACAPHEGTSGGSSGSNSNGSTERHQEKQAASEVGVAAPGQQLGLQEVAGALADADPSQQPEEHQESAAAEAPERQQAEQVAADAAAGSISPMQRDLRYPMQAAADSAAGSPLQRERVQATADSAAGNPRLAVPVADLAGTPAGTPRSAVPAAEADEDSGPVHVKGWLHSEAPQWSEDNKDVSSRKEARLTLT